MLSTKLGFKILFKGDQIQFHLEQWYIFTLVSNIIDNIKKGKNENNNKNIK